MADGDGRSQAPPSFSTWGQQQETARGAFSWLFLATEQRRVSSAEMEEMLILLAVILHTEPHALRDKIAEFQARHPQEGSLEAMLVNMSTAPTTGRNMSLDPGRTGEAIPSDARRYINLLWDMVSDSAASTMVQPGVFQPAAANTEFETIRLRFSDKDNGTRAICKAFGKACVNNTVKAYAPMVEPDDEAKRGHMLYNRFHSPNVYTDTAVDDWQHLVADEHRPLTMPMKCAALGRAALGTSGRLFEMDMSYASFIHGVTQSPKGKRPFPPPAEDGSSFADTRSMHRTMHGLHMWSGFWTDSSTTTSEMRSAVRALLAGRKEDRDLSLMRTAVRLKQLYSRMVTTKVRAIFDDISTRNKAHAMQRTGIRIVGVRFVDPGDDMHGNVRETPAGCVAYLLVHVTCTGTVNLLGLDRWRSVMRWVDELTIGGGWRRMIVAGALLASWALHTGREVLQWAESYVTANPFVVTAVLNLAVATWRRGPQQAAVVVAQTGFAYAIHTALGSIASGLGSISFPAWATAGVKSMGVVVVAVGVLIAVAEFMRIRKRDYRLYLWLDRQRDWLHSKVMGWMHRFTSFTLTVNTWVALASSSPAAAFVAPASPSSAQQIIDLTGPRAGARLGFARERVSVDRPTPANVGITASAYRTLSVAIEWFKALVHALRVTVDGAINGFALENLQEYAVSAAHAMIALGQDNVQAVFGLAGLHSINAMIIAALFARMYTEDELLGSSHHGNAASACKSSTKPSLKNGLCARRGARPDAWATKSGYT